MRLLRKANELEFVDDGDEDVLRIELAGGFDGLDEANLELPDRFYFEDIVAGRDAESISVAIRLAGCGLCESLAISIGVLKRAMDSGRTIKSSMHVQQHEPAVTSRGYGVFFFDFAEDDEPIPSQIKHVMEYLSKGSDDDLSKPNRISIFGAKLVNVIGIARIAGECGLREVSFLNCTLTDNVGKQPKIPHPCEEGLRILISGCRFTTPVSYRWWDACNAISIEILGEWKDLLLESTGEIGSTQIPLTRFQLTAIDPPHCFDAELIYVLAGAGVKSTCVCLAGRKYQNYVFTFPSNTSHRSHEAKADFEIVVNGNIRVLSEEKDHIFCGQLTIDAVVQGDPAVIEIDSIGGVECLFVRNGIVDLRFAENTTSATSLKRLVLPDTEQHRRLANEIPRYISVDLYPQLPR